MKKFIDKFFSNPNRLLNISCTILSVLVFALCILSVVAGFFGGTYEGSTNQMYVEDNYLTNDSYITESNNISRDKVYFTKEADGSYGQTAFYEVLNVLAKEKEKVNAEGGVYNETNGLTYAESVGMTVVQSMLLRAGIDSTKDIFYEEATKEISSSGFGPECSMKVYVSGGNARYEASNKATLSGNKVLGAYNNNIKELPYKDFKKNVTGFYDVMPLSFSTNENEIDMSSCSLSESFLGYTFIYNIKMNGNDFTKIYENKFGAAAGAVGNSTKLHSYQFVINFNKYGQVLNYDSNYSFFLKKKAMGMICDVETKGNLKSVISYKGSNYLVEKF